MEGEKLERSLYAMANNGKHERNLYAASTNDQATI